MYSKKQLEEIDARLKKESENAREEMAEFWNEEYPKLDFESKAKHWASSLHRSMRNQEESGYDAYDIYSENWLRQVLEVEPDFLELISRIFGIWSGMWDSPRIEKRIRKLYKKLNTI